MTEKKPTPEELAERIDQLQVVIREVLEDLADISRQLKQATAPAARPTAPVPVAPAPTPPVATTGRSVADVKRLFPKELEDMLVFEDKGEYIEIKPRRYLGSENFAKIASLVRGAGGRYESAGKESHFRVPK